MMYEVVSKEIMRGVQYTGDNKEEVIKFVSVYSNDVFKSVGENDKLYFVDGNICEYNADKGEWVLIDNNCESSVYVYDNNTYNTLYDKNKPLKEFTVVGNNTTDNK